MAHEPSSPKRAAVITGLTMLGGGIEVSSAIANTTTPQEVQFFSSTSTAQGTVTDPLIFSQFPGPVTSLTGVTFSLNSALIANAGDKYSASIQVNGATISSLSETFPGIFGGATVGYNNTAITGLVGAADAGFYTGSGNITVDLNLTCTCAFNLQWLGNNSSETGNFTGLTLTYDFNPTTATPIPPALPLFATGLAGLGLGALRRRKQKHVSES